MIKYNVWGRMCKLCALHEECYSDCVIDEFDTCCVYEEWTSMARPPRRPTSDPPAIDMSQMAHAMEAMETIMR
ncbi:unnamed protein product [Sphenostylis stenocarpa]|uniref:Uncharacterized protein n=1 Tax=Sphenostylis stenocarpa TaxID=92480 RepID=A0AA86T650_9FABA|nr:unnamed protein product [Sphenostylis stenocarpa]